RSVVAATFRLRAQDGLRTQTQPEGCGYSLRLVHEACEISGLDHLSDPVRQCVQQFVSNFRILASRPGRHVKRMIGLRKQLECRPGAESFAKRLQKLQVREFITSSLQEQHRNL